MWQILVCKITFKIGLNNINNKRKLKITFLSCRNIDVNTYRIYTHCVLNYRQNEIAYKSYVYRVTLYLGVVAKLLCFTS